MAAATARQPARRHRLPARAGEARHALGGENYDAPGQRVADFLAGKGLARLRRVEPSYKPGVRPTDLGERGNESLPPYAIATDPRGAAGLRAPDPRLRDADAVLTGVETRTSSPLRITRGRDPAEPQRRASTRRRGCRLRHAGGIMSAGVDGIEVAEAVTRRCLTSSEQPLPAAMRRILHGITRQPPRRAYGARGALRTIRHTVRHASPCPSSRRHRRPRALFDWRCGVSAADTAHALVRGDGECIGLAELRATRAAGAQFGRGHRRAQRSRRSRAADAAHRAGVVCAFTGPA